MISKARAISFVWGFAEATVFFVVPDVWLTRLALGNLREAFAGALFALAGALAGGALVYWLGACRFETLIRFFDLIPAISAAMIDEAGRSVQTQGLCT